MYNDLMPENTFEIRKCDACGLRYPITAGHPIGTRCPVCMGDTRLILSRPLVTETGRDPDRDRRHKSHRERAVILDNIRSAWNVGSIFRSADGFGFSHAYLCGITPTGDNEAVMKTSLGAEDSVPWSYHKDTVQLVKGLKKEGWRIFALEENPTAKEIDPEAVGSGDSALILGNEISGVDPELLELSDEVLCIPMRGDKKSFNVAVAFGIAAYALDRREKKRPAGGPAGLVMRKLLFRTRIFRDPHDFILCFRSWRRAEAGIHHIEHIAKCSDRGWHSE